ncbi:MAG TPA: hypothetical protein VL970_08760, partial [Candidatus Acidoferrales bacterium]|nr:hypothetical protein [Candidatus Acidoferrales bacterium]
KCLMIRLLLACLVASIALAALGESDINLGGKITTFTNLQGRVYRNVRLERGTLDGVIYSLTNAVGGGLVKYQDLSVEFLTHLNIPSNRVQIAEQRDKLRAEQKARYYAEIRALELQEEQQEALDASNALAQARANAKAAAQNPTPRTTPTTTVRVRRR